MATRDTTTPAVRGLPVVGNTHQFLGDPFSFFERAASHGDVVGYSVAGRTGYLLTHPDDIERVLTNYPDPFRKGERQQESLGRALGRGLLTAEGDTWRRQRGLIQPAFFRERITDYATAMREETAAMADDWQDGDRVAIDAEMQKLTLDVLVRTLFGTDVDAHRETIRRAAGAIHAKADISSPAAFVPDWVPIPTNVRFRRALSDLDGVIQDLVDQRRRAGGDGDDLLSKLVAMEDEEGGLSDEEVRDQLVTFLLAGHETTALSLTYAWFLLSKHPEKRARLREEVDALDGKPTFEDIDDLTYTGHVVNEAMRLYPPVFRMVRVPTERVQIRGHDIEQGAMLTLPQWVCHRDQRWWRHAEQFRPERWAEDRDRPDFAYFPFGGGPRKCIGYQFSLVESKLILAHLARECDLNLVDPERELSLSAGVTAQPREPVEMTVRSR
jgi:cytochrome P450